MRNNILGIGGSLAAVPTPFRDGTVDYAALVQLCRRQIEAGTAALIACGSTGEATALSQVEYAGVIQAAVHAANREVPVIAGCTAPSTAVTIDLAGKASDAGADALLCAAPPYVKPTQRGIIAHIRALAHATDLPVVLYDVPSRSSVGIADDTVAWLHDHDLIVAIKDATADLSRPPRLRRLCGDTFMQWSGDDATAPGYRAMGGIGCISVTANVAPGLCAELHRAWDNGNLGRFVTIRDLLHPLHDALFAESNPIPLKAALASLGLCSSDMRLPLTRAALPTCERLLTTMTPIMQAEEVLMRTRHRQMRAQGTPKMLAGA